eukprot:GEMP01129313.1.p1 GENE.GEMP01129313.1~~GEMP01129313.1.p1  ORF type:complete len:112 (+),score=19.25 GEMP01129313.1:133-468(+)
MAVVDRFEEFCALRAQFSNEGEQLDEEENDEKPKFMTDFFADVRQVQDALAEGRSGYKIYTEHRAEAPQIYGAYGRDIYLVVGKRCYLKKMILFSPMRLIYGRRRTFFHTI